MYNNNFYQPHHQRQPKPARINRTAQLLNLNDEDRSSFMTAALLFNKIMRHDAKIALVNFFFDKNDIPHHCQQHQQPQKPEEYFLDKLNDFFSGNTIENKSEEDLGHDDDECSRFGALGESWLAMLLAESLTVQQKSVYKQPQHTSNNNEDNSFSQNLQRERDFQKSNRRFVHSNKNNNNNNNNRNYDAGSSSQSTIVGTVKAIFEQERAKSLKYSMATRNILGQFLAAVMSLHMDEAKEKRERQQQNFSEYNNQQQNVFMSGTSGIIGGNDNSYPYQEFNNGNSTNQNHSQSVVDVFDQIFKTEEECNFEQRQAEVEKFRQQARQQSDGGANANNKDNFLEEVFTQLKQEGNLLSEMIGGQNEINGQYNNNHHLNDRTMTTGTATAAAVINDPEEKRQRIILRKRRQIRALGDLFCLLLYFTAHLTNESKNADSSPFDDDFGFAAASTTKNENFLSLIPSPDGIDRSRKCFLAFKRWFVLTSEKQEQDKIQLLLSILRQEEQQRGLSRRCSGPRMSPRDVANLQRQVLLNVDRNIILSNSQFHEGAVMPSVVDERTKLFVILNPFEYGIDELCLIPTSNNNNDVNAGGSDNGGGIGLVADFSHLVGCYGAQGSMPSLSVTEGDNTIEHHHHTQRRQREQTEEQQDQKNESQHQQPQYHKQQTSENSADFQPTPITGNEIDCCTSADINDNARHTRPSVKIYYLDAEDRSSSCTKQFHPCCGLLESNTTKPCACNDSKTSKFHPGDVMEGPSSKFPSCYAHFSCCLRPVVGPLSQSDSRSSNNVVKYQIYPEYLGGCRSK